MTILFVDDWKLYPTAIADYKTTNESFRRLAYLYKEMGITNSDFLLALFQPELQGVDPFDENLSVDVKMKIAVECRYNPWYFFREVCRVPATSGTVPRRFEASRGNIALYWSFFNHVDFGLLMPRQTGKSVGTDCLMTGVTNIWASNTSISLITKDLALRARNVQRLKEIRALLPDYIYYPNRMDADNSEMITNLKLNNRYLTAVGRNDRISADKLGRGLTVPIMHLDELAYISLIEVSLPVALSSGSAARDEAAANDQPYGNVFTTTAGSLNTRDGNFAHSFLTGGIPWSENFLDLPNRETLVKIVEKGSKGLKPLIYGAFNHRQLGYTDEWLYRKLKESASAGEIADRDYMNIWTTGGEGSPLTEEEKKTVKASEIDVKYLEISKEGYTLRWYIPEATIAERMASSRFVLGSDPSEALGKDNDAVGLILIDAYTHDVVAAGRFNETNLTQLGIYIANLLIRYPSITFIPERKSSGTAIMDTIFIQLSLKNIDPFRRIFNRIVDEPETFKTEFEEIKRPTSSRPSYFYDRFKRYFGFATSGAGAHSRDALYVDALKSMLRLGAHRLHDRTLTDELLSLVVKNGRIDHSNGNHDDMVVSLLLAHWFCIKGKNLTHYGIDPLRVFSTATVDTAKMSDEQLYQTEIKQQTMEYFQTLMDELKRERDPMMVSKIEMKLRQLSNRIDVSEISGVGIDAMINQAQEERHRQLRLGQHRQRLSGMIRSFR